MKTILSSAYWPNVHYFYYVLHSEEIYIEAHEHYQKQSFRNRCQILSANGTLDLSIPVKHLATKEFTKDIEISYKENWQIKHWRAIVSAYKNSPYFEHFEEEIKDFYSKPFTHLFEYNHSQLLLLLKLLRVKKHITLSTEYIPVIDSHVDMRERIHPKIDFHNDTTVSTLLDKRYYQTFESKMEFVPNLSMLDLIFNKGLGALEYLGA